MQLRFEVAGVPLPQPRPRARREGAHARVYDPGDADPWKRAVSLTAAAFVRHAIADRDLPLAVKLRFRLPTPKARRRQVRRGNNWHATRPDVDNLAKAVMDALSGAGLWRDDARVCDLVARKNYCGPGEVPGCTIIITELEGGDDDVAQVGDGLAVQRQDRRGGA